MRAPAIERVLQRARPHICALQEVWAESDRDQGSGLAARLGMHCTYAPSPEPERWQRRAGEPDVEIGNAVLSVWPIRRTIAQLLPHGGSEDRSRTALLVEVDAPAGPLAVICTQLCSYPWASRARCQQVRALVDLLDEAEAEDALPLVLGDLNAEPDSDEVRLLCGHKTAPARGRTVLVDAWRFADPTLLPWTWDRTNPHVAATAEPSARIDYVLVGPPSASGMGAVSSAHRIGASPVGGVWASDHAGVIAELSCGGDRGS